MPPLAELCRGQPGVFLTSSGNLAMKLQCVGGPMDGAVYAISKGYPSTNRKPDGLWFDGTDEHGRNIQHQYRDAGRLAEDADGVIVQYVYDGAVVETGIEFETELSSNP